MPCLPEPSKRSDADWALLLKSTEPVGASYRVRAAIVVLTLVAVCAVAYLVLTPVWTFSVRNMGTVPCTVYVTLDSQDGQRLEFRNVPVEEGYKPFELIRRRKSAIIHSVRLVRSDGQEKVVQLDQPMSSGRELILDFDSRFEIHTDLDEDRHM